MPGDEVLLYDYKYLKEYDIDPFSMFIRRVKSLTGMAGAGLCY